ncbi:syntaxin 17 isoform X1 [Leptinotarsa decemlineata]|uniref:syntaxin 17 isoform X1 n=1 Tax=Leptinotarsa decemlineata TaxID=7539 RepID=UPI000C255227|nr:syntaxin-17 isoform X1 [Leptinotarsa decemlineata]
MKTYKMASVLNPSITKQPLKMIEVPLSKFSEEVIPHHQKVFDQYKAMIHKKISVNDTGQLKKEVKDRKRTIKQLRDLMYELDTLRTQVEDEDLDKFDLKTLSLRKILINLINGYTGLEKSVDKILNDSNITEEIQKENCDPFEGTSQIQIQGSLEEIRLKQRQDQLNEVENIHKDVEDLHEMYQSLNEIVGTQAELVENVEKNVESTQQNVESGVQSLVKAHKLKAVAYPVTGAFLGGMVGGPIGMVAGVKVGGIVAIGCAIVGYTGGRWFKKKHSDIVNTVKKEEDEINDETVPDTSLKKDI